MGLQCMKGFISQRGRKAFFLICVKGFYYLEESELHVEEKKSFSIPVHLCCLSRHIMWSVAISTTMNMNPSLFKIIIN